MQSQADRIRQVSLYSPILIKDSSDTSWTISLDVLQTDDDITDLITVLCPAHMMQAYIDISSYVPYLTRWTASANLYTEPVGLIANLECHHQTLPGSGQL